MNETVNSNVVIKKLFMVIWINIPNVIYNLKMRHCCIVIHIQNSSAETEED